MAKTWTEKFNNGKTPVVAPTNRTISGFPIGSLMLVPTPAQVDDYLRSIPRGQSRTPAEMARDLAHKNGAELTCPMCCGLFVRICAERAFEELQAGAEPSAVTPFWRILPPGQKLRNKLSFDPEVLDSIRKSEGL